MLIEKFNGPLAWWTIVRHDGKDVDDWAAFDTSNNVCIRYNKAPLADCIALVRSSAPENVKAYARQVGIEVQA